jgi:c-di-AMP phosphodiesterase-like protein
MERLGGGGHMNIAGAQIADISPQTAILIVKETLDNMIEDGSI